MTEPIDTPELAHLIAYQVARRLDHMHDVEVAPRDDGYAAVVPDLVRRDAITAAALVRHLAEDDVLGVIRCDRESGDVVVGVEPVEVCDTTGSDHD